MDSETLQASYGSRFLEEATGPQNSYQRVREFMERFGHPVFDTPTEIEDDAWEQMRLELIREEFCELLDAMGYPESAHEIREVALHKESYTDIVETADALGDMEYVVNGLAIGMGIDLPAVVKEIHRSNMTKLGADGKPIYREDGKILKGEGYEPPQLEKVLWSE